jgi:hypothetical protein
MTTTPDTTYTRNTATLTRWVEEASGHVLTFRPQGDSTGRGIVPFHQGSIVRTDGAAYGYEPSHRGPQAVTGVAITSYSLSIPNYRTLDNRYRTVRREVAALVRFAIETLRRYNEDALAEQAQWGLYLWER